METQFIEILFEEDVHQDDLEIIARPTVQGPGRVRLNKAQIGPANPDAPNSAPLLSWTGAKIGFVAAAGLLEPPFTDCYWLEEVVEQQAANR
jgi:hypothetical protein